MINILQSLKIYSLKSNGLGNIILNFMDSLLDINKLL